MNRSGLEHRFFELTAISSDLSYWHTGVCMVRWFLIDETNRQKYVSAVEMLSEVQELASSTRCFLLYLVGKMEQFRGELPRKRWAG